MEREERRREEEWAEEAKKAQQGVGLVGLVGLDMTCPSEKMGDCQFKSWLFGRGLNQFYQVGRVANPENLGGS